MEVSGATVSTVHARLAGVASTLPARSIARTSNVWMPSERPVGNHLAHDLDESQGYPP